MLLEAIKLPREIAIAQCPANSKGSSKIQRNKELAAKAARAAACQPIHQYTAITTLLMTGQRSIIQPKYMQRLLRKNMLNGKAGGL